MVCLIRLVLVGTVDGCGEGKQLYARDQELGNLGMYVGAILYCTIAHAHTLCIVVCGLRLEEDGRAA